LAWLLFKTIIRASLAWLRKINRLEFITVLVFLDSNSLLGSVLGPAGSLGMVDSLLVKDSSVFFGGLRSGGVGGNKAGRQPGGRGSCSCASGSGRYGHFLCCGGVFDSTGGGFQGLRGGGIVLGG